jgi:hypothetical protein
MRTAIRQAVLASLFLSAVMPVAAPAYAAPLYFPHVDTKLPWQTEIAVINTGDQSVTGTLRAFSNSGQLVETKAVSLTDRDRRQIDVATEFVNHADIGYIIFDTDSDAIQGYEKFYRKGVYRTVIPAVKELNTFSLYVPHIASDTHWWTQLSLLNTTSSAKQLGISVNTGKGSTMRSVTLNANERRVVDIASFFGGVAQPEDIRSAVIGNAVGIIGLGLFGHKDGNQLGGILLTGQPHRLCISLTWPAMAGGPG